MVVLSVVAVRNTEHVVVVLSVVAVCNIERLVVVQDLTSSEKKSLFRNQASSQTSVNTDDYRVYVF